MTTTTYTRVAHLLIQGEQYNSECAFTNSPSHENAVCNDFKNHTSSELKPWSSGVVISFNQGKKTICYSSDVGRFLFTY